MCLASWEDEEEERKPEGCERRKRKQERYGCQKQCKRLWSLTMIIRIYFLPRSFVRSSTNCSRLSACVSILSLIIMCNDWNQLLRNSILIRESIRKIERKRKTENFADFSFRSISYSSLIILLLSSSSFPSFHASDIIRHRIESEEDTTNRKTKYDCHFFILSISLYLTLDV